MEFIKDTGKSKHGKKLGLYKCQCGNEKIIEQYRVNNGVTKSCGCVQGEKHGDRHTKLYQTWSNMKARCNRNTHPQYNDYGGRGIAICYEWLNSYMSFKEWAKDNGYSDELTIDRIDVNGNYEPSNCRWVNHKVQNNNTRRNIYVDKNITLTEKCEELGIDSKLIQARIREQGMSFNEAIKLSQNFRYYKINYKDKEYNLKELCGELSLNYDTVYKRIKKYNKTLQEATNCDTCQWILDTKGV